MWYLVSMLAVVALCDKTWAYSAQDQVDGLAIESVVIETTSPSSERPSKTLTTTATADEGLGVEEEGFRGVLINALDPSDVLESGEGDCLPFTSRLPCCVRSAVQRRFTARVSYEGALQTTLTVPFQVKDGADCQLPFEVLADRCVLVDAVISGTWDEMKLFCHQLGGQLAKVDQLEFMYHLVKYIRDNGIDDNNYWIGGSETATEGEFLWLDGDKVRQGTPYWSYESGAQRPVSDSSLRCIAMGQSVFYYFIDSLCNESYAAVCEKLA